MYVSYTINSSMLINLGTLASAQAKGTEATAQAITQLLNYCATHPSTTVSYSTSEISLHIHSDTSYLSEANWTSAMITWDSWGPYRGILHAIGAASPVSTTNLNPLMGKLSPS
jgi:hypothetical protein